MLPSQDEYHGMALSLKTPGQVALAKTGQTDGGGALPPLDSAWVRGTAAGGEVSVDRK